jgi:hypothetical protein
MIAEIPAMILENEKAPESNALDQPNSLIMGLKKTPEVALKPNITT